MTRPTAAPPPLRWSPKPKEEPVRLAPVVAPAPAGPPPLIPDDVFQNPAAAADVSEIPVPPVRMTPAATNPLAVPPITMEKPANAPPHWMDIAQSTARGALDRVIAKDTSIVEYLKKNNITPEMVKNATDEQLHQWTRDTNPRFRPPKPGYEGGKLSRTYPQIRADLYGLMTNWEGWPASGRLEIPSPATPPTSAPKIKGVGEK